MAFKPLTVSTPIGEKAHVLAEDDAALYDGIFGEDCVLKLGEQFASKTISNNVIRVMDGVVVVGGHVGRIIKGDYEDMMIDNGVSGQKRNDLIVARFKSGGTGGADTYSLVVVKGTPGATAKDPAIVQEDLYAGGKQRDYPLYRVRLENLSVVGVDKLFQVNRNFKVLAEEFESRFKAISSGSVLDVKENGVYYVFNAATDKPDGTNHGLLIVGYSSDSNRTYLFITTNGEIHTRRISGGSDLGWGCKDNDLQKAIDALSKTLESRTNGKVRVYENAEGGNIEITSKDGIKWEIDANANHLRVYSFGSSNKYVDYTFKYDRVGGVVATVEEVSKKMDKMTVVNNATTTGAGTVLDGRMGKTLNDKAVAAQNTANTLKTNLQNDPIGIGSAYGVTATAYSSIYMESVYFNGTNVGDSLAAYTQRNFGTLPAGHRPKTKVQVPVPAIDGLYFTIDTNGVVSMRNEKSTTISFGKCAMHGVITFVK